MSKIKVLEIGPSIVRAKGGMSKVILDIKESDILNKEFDIDIYESYIDGNLIQRLVFSIKSFLKFKRIYIKYDIFHIHVASYGSTFRKGMYINFLKRKNKKIIFHVHGGGYLEFIENSSKLKKKLINYIWQQVDEIIVLSDWWKEQFEKIFHLNNIVTIGNGVNVDLYKTGRCSYEDGKNTFIFIGRIVKGKGVYDIIDAFKKLNNQDIKIIFIGDGEVEELKKYILDKTINNEIEFVGWCSPNEIVNIMKHSVGVLLPSYSEGLPICILEGMAAGKTIISTNVGAIEEVVKNQVNGFIIEPSNIEELSLAIQNVNKEVYDRCYQNNIKDIEEKFDIKDKFQQIISIYKQKKGKNVRK